MGKLIEKHFSFQSNDGRDIFLYQWTNEKEIRGVVQISHGMAETAARYKRFAQALVKAGFVVYANDHRGHGKSADAIELQGYLGEENGFKRLIADMVQLTDLIKENHPNQPIFLFSHSMGSFASQRYIMDFPNKINGLILSGSNGPQGAALTAGKIVAKIEMILRGKKAKSKLMNKLTFGAYNKKFELETQATGWEWLTRDQEEIAKYIANPYCGQIFPTSFYYEFLDSLQYVENIDNFHKIPKDLPIYILSGEQDPVGDFGKGVLKLKGRYENLGVKDLEMKLYEGARHELLNEINRKEVTRDIIRWLKKRTEEPSV